MSSKINIGVLCNSRLGIPSLQALLHNKLVNAVAIPGIEHEATADIRHICGMYGVQPTTLPKKGLQQAIQNWITVNSVDLVIVFTFPWRIPKDVLNLPAHGFLNFHFGLLPAYRGADAIFHAIKNREPYGGISVHVMDEHFDTGPLLHVERVPIDVHDTYGMLTGKLAVANMHLLQRLIPLLYSGQVATTQQDEDKACYYGKPSLQDVSINWQEQDAYDIQALVNACNPWNKGAYATINGAHLRIAEARASDSSSNAHPGQIINIDEKGIIVGCTNNTNLLIKVIYIDEGIFSAFTYSQACGIKNGMLFNNINTLQTV